MKRIKLGISISLTGAYSVQGAQSFRGLSLYVSDVNERGGIHVAQLERKIPVDLVHFDDESDVDKCRSNVEKLLSQEQVDILLGPYSSSLALAAAEEAEPRGVTLWNHGGSTDEMDERGFTVPRQHHNAGEHVFAWDNRPRKENGPRRTEDSLFQRLRQRVFA
ncbi:MAG: ABC transporter substrate-binding protein [Thermodesulfobacteriota bacterium]